MAAVEIGGQRIYFKVPFTNTWSTHTLEFTATSASTTIKFISWGHLLFLNNPSDTTDNRGTDELVLDKVIVQEAASSTATLTIKDNGQGCSWFEASNTTGIADPNGALNDDRVNTPLVNDRTVNEGSPSVVFTAQGMPGGEVTLAIAEGAETAGTPSAADVMGLEWFDAASNQWVTYGGTATIGADGTLLVRTSPVADTAYEQSETFTLTVTYTGAVDATINPTGTVTAGGAAAGIGTIKDDATGQWFTGTSGTGSDTAPSGLNLDDDRPLAVNDIRSNEGSTFAVFEVSGTSGQLLSLALQPTTAASGNAILGTDTANAGSGVPLQVFNGTAWVDYAPGSLVTMPAGDKLLVRTRLVNDATFEGPETFRLVATNVGGTTAIGTATITDDGTGDIYPNNTTGAVDAAASKNDDRPSFAVSDVTRNEAAGTMTFTITKTGTTELPATVNYATADGTATAGDVAQGADYEAANGTLSFAANETSKTVTISIGNNNVFEGTETFDLNLSAATNARISDATGVGTIKDDGTGSGGTSDDRPLFTVNDVTVNEGAGTMTFTVTRTGDATLNSTVAYTTASGTATSGTDFTAASGTLTFAPGETTKTITVPITNDAGFEGSETLTVILSSPTNALIWDGTGVGTILDDGKGAGGTDDDRAIKVSDVCVNEGSPYAVFTVNYTANALITFQLSDGTASVAGDLANINPGVSGSRLQYLVGTTWTDYVSGSVVTVDGTGQMLVRVAPNNDAIFEEVENLQLKVSPAIGASHDIAGVTVDVITNSNGAPLPVLDRSKNLVQNGDLTAADAGWWWGKYNLGDGRPFASWTIDGGGTHTYAQNFPTGGAPDGATPPWIYFGNMRMGPAPGSPAFNFQTAFDMYGIATTPYSFVNWEPAKYGTSPVTISQNISTVAGQSYVLQFWQRSEWAFTGPMSDPSQGALADTRRPDGIAALELGGQRVFFRVNSGSDRWQRYTFGFTATGSTTNLAFMSWGHYQDAQTYLTDELGIDDIIVNALPSPSTATLTIKDNGQGCSWFEASNVTGIADPDGPLNDDRGANPVVNDVTVNEGAPSVVFTVLGLPGAHVDLAIVEGADAAGSTGADVTGLQWFDAATSQWLDYSSVSPAVVGADGTLLVRTTPVNDVVFEVSETFDLTATYTNDADNTALGVTLGASATGVGTIKDDGTGQWFTGESGIGSDTAPVGTRLNDDRTVSVNSITVNEGTHYAVFTVTGAAGQYVSLALAPTGSGTGHAVLDVDTQDAGSAMPLQYFDGSAWVDYTPGSLVPMPAGTMLVRTRIVNDIPFEDAETFALVATNAGGTSATGTCTITDDGTGNLYSSSNTTGTPEAPGTNGLPGALNDDRPITVSDLQVNEAVGNAVFTVTGTPGQVVNSLVLAAGTATSGTDYGTSLSYSVNGGTNWLTYTHGSTSITIPAGGSFLVRNSITNDSPYEGGETYTLTATPRGGNAATGTATILDDGTGTGGTNDDRAANPSVNDLTVNEGTPYAVFIVKGLPGAGMTLSLANGTSNPATVGTDTGAAAALEYYSETANGGAGGWLTYGTSVTLPASGTLLVRTTIANDVPLEVSETFRLTATYNGTGGGTNGGSDTGIGTIKDDGTGDLFSAANTSGIADPLGSQPDLPAALDDDRPSFSVGDVTYNEAAGTITFTVTKTGSTTQSTTVAYATADGTAVAGQDYTATSGTLTFTASETTKTVTVPITNDAIFERSETLDLNLSNPTNARIGDGTGVGTIKDDGTGTGGTNDDRPQFAVADVLVDETAGTLTFTVTKTGQTAFSASVDYAIVDGTGSTGALLGSDYSQGTDPLAGTLTFAAGETSKTVTVSIASDGSFENLEQLLINLTNPPDAAIADPQGVGQIVDLPTVTIGDATVIEATDPYAVVTVSLSQASALPLTFTPSLANADTGAGFAVVGTDTQNTPSGAAIEYSLNGTTWLSAAAGVTVPAGTTSVQLRSAIRMNDGIGEPIETYAIRTNTLSFGTGGNAVTAAGVSGTVTIIDNPTMSISSVVLNEASYSAVVEVSLSLPATSPITFTPSLANGTAGGGSGAGTVGTDTGSGIEYFNGTAWVSAAGGVTIPVGGTGVLLRTTVNQDTDSEISEVVAISTGPATNVLNPAGVTGTITIKDDASGSLFSASNTTTTPDAPGTNGLPQYLDDDRPLAVNSISVNEATPFAVFTVTGQPGQLVSLALGNTASTTDRDATLGTDTANAGSGVPLQVFNGTAWVDYAPGSFVAIPAAGTTLLVRTRITNDSPPVFEGPETFTLTATNTGTTSATGICTVLDDGTGDVFPDNTTGAVDSSAPKDNDIPAVAVTSVVVNEATQYATVEVSLSKASVFPITFTPSLADDSGTVGSDSAASAALEYWSGTAWVPAAAGITLAPGTMSVLVRTGIKQDTTPEISEQIKISTGPITGTVTNAAGVTGTITIKDDASGSLFSASNTTTTPDAPGTNGLPQYLDDDRPLAVNSISVNEGTHVAVFTVTGQPGQLVSLALGNTASTTDRDATLGTDTANAGSGVPLQVFDGTAWVDYAPGSFVAIPATGTTLLVRTRITNDSPPVFEGPETFTLTATNTGTTSATGVCTVLDDGTGAMFSNANVSGLPEVPGTNDLPPRHDDDRPLAVNSVTVNEATPVAVFIVSGVEGQFVSLTPAGGSATLGTDFASALEYFNGTAWRSYTPGSFVAIPADGDATPEEPATLRVRVAVVSDNPFEDSESFTLTATNTGGGPAAGIGTIRDNGMGDIFLPSNTSGVPDAPGTPGYPASLDDDMPLVVTATGADCGPGAQVFVMNPFTGAVRHQFPVFEPTFRGGARVAVGDVDADGADEVIVASGGGRVGEIRVFEMNGTELVGFRTLPFGPRYVSGLEVAVGDADGDGDNDLITSASRGPGATAIHRVTPGAADPVENKAFRSFTAFDRKVMAGGTLAVADLNHDGRVEVIRGSGPGTTPLVNIYDVSAAPRLVDSFMPFAGLRKYTGGVSVSTTWFNDDSTPDILVAGGRNAGSTVEVYDGTVNGHGVNARLDTARLAAFANLSTRNAGVFAAAVDTDGDGVADRVFVTQSEGGSGNGIRSVTKVGSVAGTFSAIAKNLRIAAARPKRS